MHARFFLLFALAGIVLLGVVLGGCEADAPDEGSAANDTARADTLLVAEPWVRPAPEGGVTALYVTVQNRYATADTLERISTPVSERTELHETVQRDDGTTGMEELDAGMVLPPDTVSTLHPGGPHGMIYDVSPALVTGEQVEVTLHFRSAAAQTVQASVRETPPMQ